MFRLAVLESNEECRVYKCLTCARVLPLSVYPSLPSPCARDAGSRAPRCSTMTRHPEIPCLSLALSPAHGQTPPGVRPAASGEAGLPLPRTSLLYLAANPKVNSKENPIYWHVSLGKAGASQPPPNTWRCCSRWAVRLWLDLNLPGDPWGEKGVFWSVSAPCLLVRHMQYIGIIFLFICMIFFFCFLWGLQRWKVFN